VGNGRIRGPVATDRRSDATLPDWGHFDGFIKRTDLPFSGSEDWNLIKGTQNAFGFEYSE
jgi:hypothetical protein